MAVYYTRFYRRHHFEGAIDTQRGDKASRLMTRMAVRLRCSVWLSIIHHRSPSVDTFNAFWYPIRLRFWKSNFVAWLRESGIHSGIFDSLHRLDFNGFVLLFHRMNAGMCIMDASSHKFSEQKLLSFYTFSTPSWNYRFLQKKSSSPGYGAARKTHKNRSS